MQNFRAAYYKTLGFHGVEVKVSLDTLLKEPVIDINALAKFCLRYGLPAVQRVLVWKILLGVLPAQRDAWEFVEKQRKEHFLELSRTAFVLLGLYGPEQECTPEVIVKMCLLNRSYNGHRALPSGHTQYENGRECEHMHAVARIFSAICTEEHDIFWLCCRFLSAQRLDQYISIDMLSQTNVYPQINYFIQNLQAIDFPLWSHLKSLQIKEDSFAFRWFRSCFAETLPPLCLERLWDRVVAGSWLIVPFVALAIVFSVREKLMKSTHGSQVENFLKTSNISNADQVINMAIELWTKFGSPVGIDRIG